MGRPAGSNPVLTRAQDELRQSPAIVVLLVVLDVLANLFDWS